MPSSLLTLAKRAFIRVLLAFAAQYAVGVTVNRDSTDAEIVKAYRRVVRKVHPDKGGRDEDAKKLLAAKEEGDDAKKHTAKAQERERERRK